MLVKNLEELTKIVNSISNKLTIQDETRQSISEDGQIPVVEFTQTAISYTGIQGSYAIYVSAEVYNKSNAYFEPTIDIEETSDKEAVDITKDVFKISKENQDMIIDPFKCTEGRLLPALEWVLAH